MKSWLVALPIAIAAPVAAGAQTTASEDARAAELACQLAGLCGDLAQDEAEREKEAIDGIESRGLPSMGALMAASKGSPSAKAQPSARTVPTVAAPVKAQAVRTAKRNLPAPAGRRAPVAAPVTSRAVGGTAADVPAALARRAPLFVTFGLNSAKLTTDSATEVKSFAKALKDIAAAGQDKRYRIEGHTDSSGDPALNRKLSEERAAAVKAALLAAGVDASRIEVTGFGSDQPIEGYDKKNPLNRRVEAVEIK